MKCGAVHLICLSLGLGLVAPPTIAERNLIPSLDSVPDICPQRPNEPEWMQNIPLRDAYQRVLVQDIYRAQSMAQIVETESCECVVRFPTWDAAESTFKKTMPTLVGQKCCRPQTPTTVAPMNSAKKRKPSAKQSATGKEGLK